MNPIKRLLLFSATLFLCACFSDKKKESKTVNLVKQQSTDSYELSIPPKQEGLLILFPCFPCDAANTKAGFSIEEIALKNKFAVLFMNFNQHLWLTLEEKKHLEHIILEAISQNQINSNNTFIGGFSGGGNVSLLLSDHLNASNSTIRPKGVFVVDAPIDLLALYKNAQQTIEKNFSEVAIQEASWIVESFEIEFGKGESSFERYENFSPYHSKTHSIKNLSHLKETKIRLYSEPDTLWWKINRQTQYKEMNAYYLEQLEKDLVDYYGKSHIDYIQTKDKGYRETGERHPHSWSIVEPEDLIKWMLESD